MKLTSLLPNDTNYLSVAWHASETMPGVRFAIRRVSLRQRIELNRRVKELTLKYEFLRAGDTEGQLEAALSELLVISLYLEWGLESIEGLSIDGLAATPSALIDRGPEALTAEIARVVQAESSLTEAERKNFWSHSISSFLTKPPGIATFV
jgi:hypothetical protein